MKVKIGDVCTLKSGTSLKDNVLNDTGGIPYIKVSDMNLVGNEKYIITANSYADESIGTKMLFPKGTILFPKRGGAIGTNKKRIANRVVCADLNTMGVIPSEKIRPLFLYYFFQNIDFRTLYNGSSVPQINNTDIAPMEIELLSLDEQDEAIAVLEKIDSIIRKRKTELKKLDDLIKARFVELFGDPIKNPKGWEVVTIGDIVTDVRYGTSNPAVEGGRYPYLRMNNLTVDGHLDLKDLKYIDISDDEIEKYVVRKGDILFNRTNSIELVGKTAVFDLSEDMVIAGYIIRVRLTEKMLPEVLSQYLNMEAIKDILRGMAKGAVNQANINAQELQSIKVYIPEMELQKQFVKMKEQVDKSKFAVQKALEETQILFDSLMQEYFG